jgi:hypothetical protein
MIAGMDMLTTFPLVVGAIGNVSTSVLEALAERLLTLLLAVLIVGSVGVFAVTAFTWLWIKHAIGVQHASPSTARH